MAPAHKVYQTTANVLPNQAHPDMLIVVVNLSKWQAMTEASRQETGRAVAEALKVYNSQAETVLLKALPAAKPETDRP